MDPLIESQWPVKEWSIQSHSGELSVPAGVLVQRALREIRSLRFYQLSDVVPESMLGSSPIDFPVCFYDLIPFPLILDADHDLGHVSASTRDGCRLCGLR